MFFIWLTRRKDILQNCGTVSYCAALRRSGKRKRSAIARAASIVGAFSLRANVVAAPIFGPQSARSIRSSLRTCRQRPLMKSKDRRGPRPTMAVSNPSPFESFRMWLKLQSRTNCAVDSGGSRLRLPYLHFVGTPRRGATRNRHPTNAFADETRLSGIHAWRFRRRHASARSYRCWNRGARNRRPESWRRAPRSCLRFRPRTRADSIAPPRRRGWRRPA
jgi:hypothetical protein